MTALPPAAPHAPNHSSDWPCGPVKATGPPVQGEDERRAVGRRGVGEAASDGGEGGGGLVGDPVAGQGRHRLGEGGSGLGRQVGRHRAVEDHRRGALRNPGDHFPDRLVEITAHQVRGFGASDADGAAQPLQPVRLVRPDQALQPADVAVVANVERVEVDAGSPDDGRRFRGSGTGPLVWQSRVTGLPAGPNAGRPS